MVKRPRLPDHVKRVRSRGREYLYFNTGKKRDGKPIRTALPPMSSPSFWPVYAGLKASRDSAPPSKLENSMDYFEHRKRVDHQRAMEDVGRVADSMDVRRALIERMQAGELTLGQVQAELKRIQRSAKSNGKITRTQAYRGRS